MLAMQMDKANSLADCKIAFTQLVNAKSLVHLYYWSWHLELPRAALIKYRAHYHSRHSSHHSSHSFSFNAHTPKLVSPHAAASLTMAFVTPITSTNFYAPRGNALCVRRPTVLHSRTKLRMGIGEEGLEDDLKFAQNCIEEGCAVDAVQDVLTRLERRRAVLALEITKIEEVMGILAKENLRGDRNLVAAAMEAAVSIFSKADDDYPGVGSSTNPWTLDPLKKQPRY